MITIETIHKLLVESSGKRGLGAWVPLDIEPYTGSDVLEKYHHNVKNLLFGVQRLPIARRLEDYISNHLTWRQYILGWCRRMCVLLNTAHVDDPILSVAQKEKFKVVSRVAHQKGEDLPHTIILVLKGPK